jgi:hypothetical protein
LFFTKQKKSGGSNELPDISVNIKNHQWFSTLFKTIQAKDSLVKFFLQAKNKTLEQVRGFIPNQLAIG